MEIVLENAQVWIPGRRVSMSLFCPFKTNSSCHLHQYKKKQALKNKRYSTHFKLRVKWPQQKDKSELYLGYVLFYLFDQLIYI